jgi:hypothetical protein
MIVGVSHAKKIMSSLGTDASFSKFKFAGPLFELPQILTNHADSIEPNWHSSCH